MLPRSRMRRTALTITLLVILFQPAATDPRIVVDALFAAYRSLDADQLIAVLAPDIAFDDPTTRLRATGRAEMRKMAEGIKAAYRDITIDVDSMIASGNNVAAEVTISGTMMKPDGSTRHIRVRGASSFRVRDGLIDKWTDYFDARTFAEQVK